MVSLMQSPDEFKAAAEKVDDPVKAELFLICARFLERDAAEPALTPLRGLAGSPALELRLPSEPDDKDSPIAGPPAVGAHPSCNRAEGTILAEIRGRSIGNGVTAEQLGALAHIPEREARALIAHLRVVHEQPICGTPQHSYFWPRRWEDAERTLASLRSRKQALDDAITGVHSGCARQFGTLPLFSDTKMAR